MPVSPTAEGFRAAFRRPLLTFAEITWRWVVGVTATVLLLFGFFEYLDTLPVTNWDIVFLQTRHPLLVWQAITHILRGSIGRAVLSLILAALLLALIWMVAASVGRLATVQAMIEYFRTRFPTTPAAVSPDITTHDSQRLRIFHLLRLNFLRVVVVLAALLGLAGCAIIAGFTSSSADPHPVLAFVLFAPMTGIIFLVCYALNWLLTLAAVFVVRDGDDAVGAISSAVTLCRERTAAVLAVSSWTGLAHVIALVGASTVVSVPLALSGFLPWRVVALGILAVSLAYLAVADWLYTVRLAGYVCITDMPEALPVPMPPTSPPPRSEPSTTIDRDELILSDVPYPVPG
jgi:hypothetical protein